MAKLFFHTGNRDYFLLFWYPLQNLRTKSKAKINKIGSDKSSNFLLIFFFTLRNTVLQNMGREGRPHHEAKLTKMNDKDYTVRRPILRDTLIYRIIGPVDCH